MTAEKPDDSSPELAKRAMRGRRPDADTADRREPTPAPPARRTAVEKAAGAVTGIYEPGELEALREDWPA